MKGLQLAREYFDAHGAPMIERKFASCRDRIAAGLVGDGSECFGFDDEISRDHDWGPSFILWLTREDYSAIGEALQAEYDKLPGEFAGMPARTPSVWGMGRVGVFEIGAFYRQFTGLESIPQTLSQWRAIPEENLAVCTNGEVFTDPAGEFTRIREALLGGYPEDLRRKKLASYLMSAAQSGQYNFLRSVRRGELVAAQYAETRYIADVISIAFLLNRRYRPFYKWMHRSLAHLPILGSRLHAMLSDLVTIHSRAQGATLYRMKALLIEEIARTVIGGLREQGLSDSESDFLLDHGPEVQKRIEDPVLRAQSVWA